MQLYGFPGYVTFGFKMVFTALHAARNFEKKHFAFIATAEDFDLVCEIGYCMELGMPLTMKQLLAQDIASPATLTRRLTRLKQRGAVLQCKSAADARRVEFRLAPHVVEAFTRYGELLAMIGADHRRAAALPALGTGRR